MDTKIIMMGTEKMDKTAETNKPKEKKKRIVTETKKWNEHIVSQDEQYEWLRRLDAPDQDKQLHFLRDQIQQKINSYKYQDLKKKKYNAELFVTISFVLDLLMKSNLCCFYCKLPVLLWYDFSREPKQWSLERIDNAFGHNCDNVEIACLSCNLKRRCMYFERYRYTKQLVIVKELSKDFAKDSSEK